MKKLTRRRTRHRAIRGKKRRSLDFSDVPPVLDWRGAEIGKFYRPAKKPVTMRLDSDVIEWLKATAVVPDKANGLLRHACSISRQKSVPAILAASGGLARLDAEMRCAVHERPI